MPISVSASDMSYVFKRLSNTDEELREGVTFTSTNHGYSSSSIIISNPYISKQDYRGISLNSMVSLIFDSTAMSVLIIISFISSFTSFQSRSFASKYS